MKFTAVCLGLVALLAILTTGQSVTRPKTFMGKIADRRLRRQAEGNNVNWWFKKYPDECEKRWKVLTVTACGVDHTERVPTCEGLCNSETSYKEGEAPGEFKTVHDCRCCFIQDGSIKWENKIYPGCPESVSIPRDLTCECNKCLRNRELRDGAPFSIA